MSHCDEKIESTNNSENEIQNAILPEVKEDKEPKNEKEPEEDKEKVVSGKTKESKSPGTPRRNVTKLMGAALLPFGRCLKPTTSDASQQKINGESAFANKGETEMVPLRLAVENDEPRSVEKARSSFVDKALTFACLVVPKSARPSSVEKPPSEEKAHPDVPVVVLPSLTDADEKARSNVPGVVLTSSTDTVSVTAEESEDIEPRLVPVVAELKDAVVVAELKDVVGKLTEAINNNFAKDPLESLYKERDELRQLVLAIGGLTTVASFSSPPGGLDSNGYIRFRHTSCHAAYLVLSHIGFVLTLFNLAQLHKPIEEQANKAKTLRTRLNIGWFFLWLAVALFFGTFTAGFWLVFPAKEPKGSVHKTSGHNIWPRWFILGTSIVKVFGSVVFVFGKMIWSKLVG